MPRYQFDAYVYIEAADEEEADERLNETFDGLSRHLADAEYEGHFQVTVPDNYNIVDVSATV